MQIMLHVGQLKLPEITDDLKIESLAQLINFVIRSLIFNK
jgi:hypothetical protein